MSCGDYAIGFIAIIVWHETIGPGCGDLASAPLVPVPAQDWAAGIVDQHRAKGAHVGYQLVILRPVDRLTAHDWIALPIVSDYLSCGGFGTVYSLHVIDQQVIHRLFPPPAHLFTS